MSDREQPETPSTAAHAEPQRVIFESSKIHMLTNFFTGLEVKDVAKKNKKAKKT